MTRWRMIAIVNNTSARLIGMWCFSVLTVGAWSVNSGASLTIPNGGLLFVICVVPPLATWLMWRSAARLELAAVTTALRTDGVKIVTACLLASVAAFGATACTQDAQAREAQQIEEQYGIAGVRPDTVATDQGTVKGTLVPITLANGRQANLFIPEKSARDAHRVYVRDQDGLHPVQLRDQATREEVTRAPAIVERRQEPPHADKRSWEKELLIIGGSAGAGTAIGAAVGGKKGAGIGAATGGIGGLIYDLMTKDKK